MDDTQKLFSQNQKIEITPEMIEAGSAVLCRMERAFADEEFWAAEVYRSMASLRPSSGRGSS